MAGESTSSMGGAEAERGCIFEAYRAIGSVTGDYPFSVHTRGKVGYVTTCVGRTWHLYTLAKLQLKLVGPEHPGAISQVVTSGDLTIASVGSTLCLSRRAHLLRVYDKDEEGVELGDRFGQILDMVLIGTCLLTLHDKGSLLRWSLLARGKGAKKRSSKFGDHLEHSPGQSKEAAGAGQNGANESADADDAEEEEENADGDRARSDEDGLVLEDAITFDAGFDPCCLCHPPAYLNKVVVGSRTSARAELWNVMTRKRVYAFDFSDKISAAEDAGIVRIVPSPALDVVAVVLARNEVVLHNLKFDERVTDFKFGKSDAKASKSSEGRDAITTCAFSSGTGLPLLSLGTASGAILVFNLEKRHLHCLMGMGGRGSDVMSHSQKVVSLYFVPGKPIMMSSSEDNSIKQWVFDTENSSDNQPQLLRFRQGHALPPTLIRHYDRNGGTSHQQASDNVGGSRLLSCSVDKTFRVFSAHKDDQSFEMSQKRVARRSKRIKLADSSELKLSRVVDLAFCSLRENEWCNVVTAHEGATCAYTWRLNKQALGEFTLQPPLSECIPLLNNGKGPQRKIDTHGDAQHLMREKLLSPVTSVAISNCGHYAIVGCESGRMDRYNLQSGFHRGAFYRYSPGTKIGGPLMAHDAAVSGIQCDAYNKEIYSAGSDATLRIWAFSDAQKAKERLSGGNGGGWAGKRRGDLLMHEEEMGGPITKLVNHRHSSLLGFVQMRKADPLGERVAENGSADPESVAEISLYDTWAKKVVRRFNGRKKERSSQLVHKAGAKINDMCFSQDGKWLLTCDSRQLIAIWDIPGAQVLQVMRVPNGSSCVSLSLSPGKTMLATCHEDSKGIFLWTNTLVSRPGETGLALTHSKKAIRVDLPLANAAAAGSDPMDIDDDEEEDEEELLDVFMDVNTAGSVGRIGGDGGLVTLSGLPRSYWSGLMHQEEIKERNREKSEAVKSSVPFFLGGASPGAGVLPGWAEADQDEAPGEGKARGSRIMKDGAGSLNSKILTALESGDRDKAKALSPSEIYREVCQFQNAEILAVLRALQKAMRSKLDFDLTQGILSLVLRIHLTEILHDENLSAEAGKLRRLTAEAWQGVGDTLGRVQCLLNHFTKMY